jgi:hypothetical protein
VRNLRLLSRYCSFEMPYIKLVENDRLRTFSFVKCCNIYSGIIASLKYNISQDK